MATTSGASIRTRNDVGPLRQPPDQRTGTVAAGCQRGCVVRPAVEPIDQRVNLRQQFQMGQFRTGHGSRIAATGGDGEGGGGMTKDENRIDRTK